ncbi:MAG: 50S ribosomal protein L21e [Candidatus Diapherotrites archaeon]|nr:50S ribosomal protein L21e [Candidatus Diapherotrites archaeon]
MSSKASKGKRKKSRDLMKRRGPKPSVNDLMAVFSVGTRVHIKLSPSIHSGLPSLRFQGKTGEVIGKRGRSYVVAVRLGNQARQLIIPAAHLQAAGPVKTTPASMAAA